MPLILLLPIDAHVAAIIDYFRHATLFSPLMHFAMQPPPPPAATPLIRQLTLRRFSLICWLPIDFRHAMMLFDAASHSPPMPARRLSVFFDFHFSSMLFFGHFDFAPLRRQLPPLFACRHCCISGFLRLLPPPHFLSPLFAIFCCFIFAASATPLDADFAAIRHCFRCFDASDTRAALPPPTLFSHYFAIFTPLSPLADCRLPMLTPIFRHSDADFSRRDAADAFAIIDFFDAAFDIIFAAADTPSRRCHCSPPPLMP